ncbi:MAG: hypothetical protein ACREAA_04545 [Candidatus Polarisedimenticolia bacterium]
MSKRIALCAAVALCATPAAASEWHWSVTPYLWATGVNLDVDVDNEPILAADVSFSDLVEDLDMAVMGRFEGRRGEWGFLGDTFFAGLSDESTSAARPPLPGGTKTESDLDTWIAEATAFWRPSGKEHGFDLLFGTRLLSMDLDVEVALPSPSTVETTVETSKTYLDGFVGARWSAGFAKRWDIQLRGDVGAGGTELSWNAEASAGVFFDEQGRYTLRFGYRHLEFEFEDDDDVTIETDLAFYGPFVGFTFAWGDGA